MFFEIESWRGTGRGGVASVPCLDNVRQSRAMLDDAATRDDAEQPVCDRELSRCDFGVVPENVMRNDVRPRWYFKNLRARQDRAIKHSFGGTIVLEIHSRAAA